MDSKLFKGRDLLAMSDLTGDEINSILDSADLQKEERQVGVPHPHLKGKILAMIFQKASTRTRVSFEVAMFQLGGHGLYLNANDLQLGRGESVADTGRVLSRYVDGIMIRTYAQADVEELARHATVPVINGLTDLEHPCQVLADLQTIREHKGRLKGLKLAYVGDGNNVCHSMLIGCAKTGMHISVASPEGYWPQEAIISLARQEAGASGSRVEIVTDPVRAVTGADVVVTDVWASMGQEAEQASRLRVFAPYQVNLDLVRYAKADYIFLHCLPAHRGEEVSDAVIDGPHSVVLDEAENRLHVQKAVLSLLI